MVMPASRWAPRPCAGVAGFPWNQWQLCYGISGNFRVEQVAALAWNRWQDSPGIGGSFGVEYAHIGILRDNAQVRPGRVAEEGVPLQVGLLLGRRHTEIQGGAHDRLSPRVLSGKMYSTGQQTR